MKRYRFTILLAAAFGLFNLAAVAAPFLGAGGVGEIGHRTLIYNYPLSWLLWELNLLDRLIASPRWVVLGFYTTFGALMYAGAGAMLGRLVDGISSRA